MNFLYEKLGEPAYFLEGDFGLEKECLRVDKDGYLSHTTHPFPDDASIDRDFCENQIEMITGVYQSAKEVCSALADLQKKVTDRLLQLNTGAEYLWPFSNPPYVKGEEDIPIATFSGKAKEKQIYREYLAKKYGKKKMLFSGIHFNYSFSEKWLMAEYNKSEYSSYKEFKNDLYLELSKKIVKRSWFIVYLTAASPVIDGSYYRQQDLGMDVASRYASIRCGEAGYWNTFTPILNYDNLEGYADSIQSYVDNGQLKAFTELYYPVRLKPKGQNTLENLKENGINHIELRMLDVNPLSPVGIMEEDLEFLHYFIWYLLFVEDEKMESFEQVSAIRNMKMAALYDEQEIRIESGWCKNVTVRDAALEILEDMERCFARMGRKQIPCILAQQQKILQKDGRYAVQIKKQFQHQYVEKGIRLAKQYTIEAKDRNKCKE